MNSIFLNNGNKIPILGLGTWLMNNDSACDTVKNAIKASYSPPSLYDCPSGIRDPMMANPK